MGSVTVMVTPVDADDLGLLKRALRKHPGQSARRRMDSTVNERFASMDKDKSGTLEKAEVPRTLQRFFDRLDKDGDGALTLEEARGIMRLRRR